MNIDETLTFEPDPVFADRYEAERERVLATVEHQPLGVFHVGSTAIADLPGKSALDVIAVFPDRESMHAAGDALAETDYDLAHDGPDCRVCIRVDDEYAAFVKLHSRDDEKVRNQLVVREYLRENADARREYERVKREAVADHPDDQEAYTRAKSAVVGSLLERARDQGYADDLPTFA